MLAPKKIKHKKLHRKQIKKINRIRPLIVFQKINYIQIYSTISTLITAKQIEAVRKKLARPLKQICLYYTYIFPDLPTSAKPTAMRMGKGKGNFKEWVCKIKAGTRLYRIKGIALPQLKIILHKKFNKFPFHLKIS